LKIANNAKVPLIKEYRIDKLKKCLECIDKYAFKRDKQKECILSLYPNKKGKSLEHREKSIFRGMVIPSLRYLGLILGDADSIRASANGKLIIESQYIDKTLHQQVLRAVIYEMDKNVFHFIDIIKNSTFLKREQIISNLCDRINALSERQKRERVNKWLSILEQVELIACSSQKMYINNENYYQTIKDVDVKLKNIEIFEKCFFDAYFNLSKAAAGVVDIVDLREKVSMKMLKQHKLILTENQFDDMLRQLLFQIDNYVISLGKPMGAREKLFEYKGNYFKTIIVDVTKKGG